MICKMTANPICWRQVHLEESTEFVFFFVIQFVFIRGRNIMHTLYLMLKTSLSRINHRDICLVAGFDGLVVIV